MFNVCLFIAGSFWLQIDDGYDGHNLVAVNEIVEIFGARGNHDGGLISSSNKRQHVVWDRQLDRFLTFDEIVTLLKTCQ